MSSRGGLAIPLEARLYVTAWCCLAVRDPINERCQSATCSTKRRRLGRARAVTGLDPDAPIVDAEDWLGGPSAAAAGLVDSPCPTPTGPDGVSLRPTRGSLRQAPRPR